MSRAREKKGPRSSWAISIGGPITPKGPPRFLGAGSCPAAPQAYLRNIIFFKELKVWPVADVASKR
jgi:hypothetical protein